MTDLPSPRLEVQVQGKWTLLEGHDFKTIEEMVAYLVDDRDNHPEIFSRWPLRIREDREGSSHKVYPDPHNAFNDKSPFEGGWDPLLLHGMV